MDNTTEDALQLWVIVDQVLLLTLQLALMVSKCVVVRIVFVAHGYLDLLEDAKHIFCLQKFILYMLQDC
jgi:hypothetical protein